MKVVSINGLAINDGAAYYAWLETPFSQPANRLEVLETAGDPLVGQSRRQALTMELHIQIVPPATESVARARRETLLANLDTSEGAVMLLVTDDDGSLSRYRYVVTQGVDEQPVAEGMGVYFVATLVTHGRTPWRSTTVTTATKTLTPGDNTLAVSNGGTLPAAPVYTLRPTEEKAEFYDFQFRRFAVVEWSGGERRSHPVDVAGASLPLATLYGTEVADDANLGVLVDGRYVRRWISNDNTDEASVWVNLDFAYPATSGLVAEIGAADVVESITGSLTGWGPVTRFPASGLLLIDDEVFRYSGVDAVENRFLNVQREVGGTVAGTHTAGTTIHWLQHEIWIVYGGDRSWSNLEDTAGVYAGMAHTVDSFRPMFELFNSSNERWYFVEFGTDGLADGPRTAQWKPVGHTRSFMTDGEPWEQIGLRSESGAGYASEWQLPVACVVTGMAATGRGAFRESGTTWRVEIGAQSSSVLSVPFPVLGPADNWSLWDESANGLAIPAEFLFFRQFNQGATECFLDNLTVEFVEAPVVTLLPEAATYPMAATLENTVTGQSITLTRLMDVGQHLEVDTANYRVRLVETGENVWAALGRNTRRRLILPLQAGSNTLEFSDPGFDEVELTVSFEAQYYS